MGRSPVVVLPMALCGTGGIRGLEDRLSTLALVAGTCKVVLVKVREPAASGAGGEKEGAN